MKSIIESKVLTMKKLDRDMEVSLENGMEFIITSSDIIQFDLRKLYPGSIVSITAIVEDIKIKK